MKRIFVIGTAIMMISTLMSLVFSRKKGITKPVDANAPTKMIYDFTVNTLDGKSISLRQFEGKKIVIMNTASKCGYTSQYADWEKFYQQHRDKIVVLGFPSNNFRSQEPGTNVEIAEFCRKNYGVTFPMFEKVDVIGVNQNQVYKWLTTKELNGWNDKVPTWNFCKYVIDEKGQLTHFFASKVKPGDEEFKIAVGL